MGQSPSKHADYIILLKTLLRSSGVKVKGENLRELFDAIHKHCYWLDPEKGTLRVEEGKAVMRCVRRAYHCGEAVSLSVWSLCNITHTTLAPLQSENSDSSEKEDFQERIAVNEEEDDGFTSPHIYENIDKGSREGLLLNPKHKSSSGTHAVPARPASFVPVSQPSAPGTEPPNLKTEPPPRNPKVPWDDGAFLTSVTIPNKNPLLSGFQRAILQARREGDLDLLVFPVQAQRIPPKPRLLQGGIRYDYEPLSFKVVKEIKQACTKYGCNSPYTVGLIQALAQSERITPYDWEMIARTCLTASEFLQFKTWWQDEAAQIARHNTAANPPVNIVMEQLMGTGEYTGIQNQLRNII
uniref:Beta-retroviral matrix protein domain-containing protein n=1 Tax=Sus scrofa TaxID=9823 RepID=A0A8D0Y4E0_PIG